ncbi:MAG TPA: sigma-70 family RNA polymerase sigma factor [Bacteroidia bacterium]|nr:sigma-70 family RNA polymerase sigma factor [Bacteroidia bacterium]HRH08110.1 sigma-70 family RNA polymerase sigma factor [Bacteroidia bacterium]
MNSNTINQHLLSDTELVLRYAQSNDVECFGILFTRYSSFVYAVCLKYLKDRDESKDASMQIFEKLTSDLKKHTITNFKSWLHTVTKNYCLMQLRKNKGIIEISSDQIHFIQPSMDFNQSLHQVEENEKEELLTRLEQAITKLNQEQKACIELFYIKEMSYQEISNITGYDLKSVKSFIQNGKRNLKILISKKNVDKN